MASYTNRLTRHPNVFVEQNIWSNGELMGFSPINVMWMRPSRAGIMGF